ncbi:substrate-binding periplasmic protein [Pseudoalteromonas mariniglutinosa]|uniref:substrate-binding periplasmic protein n=1 Tax=Pseudoalteromonas mariniglutinosa TaxID=206042 RepID=UPI00384B902D
MVTIYTEQFPPYNFSNKGQLQGINLDFVRQLCKQTNIDCQFKLLPWSRSYRLTLEQPLSGLISTARTDEREELFQWIGPLVSSRNYFYRMHNNNHINPTQLSELKNYTLGVIRDSVYEAVIEDLGFITDKNVLKFSHHYEYINLFFKNKLDLIIGSELSLYYQLQQYGYSSENVVRLLELPLSTPTGNYLALNKQMPAELVARLQIAFAKLVAEGALEQHKNTYFKGE